MLVTSVFAENNKTILYHNKYHNYQKYVYCHLKHLWFFLFIERDVYFFLNSCHGNFKILSVIFPNIFWLNYKCGFVIWTLFFSYRQASAIWIWSSLLHIYYIPYHIVGAIISELEWCTSWVRVGDGSNQWLEIGICCF